VAYFISRPSASFIAALALALCAGSEVRSQTDYFWNAPTGGTGTWNTTTQNWSSVAVGPVNYTWTNSGAERANFGNTAGTVTVASISAYGINFLTSGYTIASSTLTMTGTGGVIDVPSGMSETVSSVIAGSVGLTKTSAGTLTVSGADTYTGGTAIQNGTVIISAGADRLPTTSVVTLGNGGNAGVLQLGDTAARNQTVGGLTTSGSAGAANAVVGGFTAVSTLTINNTSDFSYSGAIGGTGTNQNNLALTKNGTGTQTLSGPVQIAGGTGTAINVNAGTLVLNAANTLTGTGAAAISVNNGGTLVGIAQPSGSPFSTVGLTINTGVVRLTGINATTSTAAGNVTVNGWANNLIIDNTAGGGATTTTLAAGTATRSGTTSMVITPVTGALGTREIITFTGGTGITLTNGILSPWIVTQTSGSDATADFVTYNGPGTTGVGVATYTSTDLTTSDNTKVVNQSSPVTLSAAAVAYSVKTNQAINLGSNTLTIGNGSGQAGLILNSGGTVGSGSLAFSGEGMIYVAAPTTVAADIAASNSRISAFGPGNLTLTGNMNVTTAFSLQNSLANGGTLALGATTASTSTVTVNAGNSINFSPGVNAAIVVNDVITGPGMVLYGGNGAGFTLLNSQNTYSGNTRFNSGCAVQFSVDTVLNGSTIVSGPFGVGTIEPNNSSNNLMMPVGGNRTIANPILMTTGFTVANATGDTSSVTFTGAIAMTATGRTIANNMTPTGGQIILGSASTPSTLTLATAASQTLTFNTSAGGVTVINDLIQNSGSISTAITYSGNGTYVLTAQNTYNGTTQLNGAGTIFPLSISSNALPGASFTTGPFGVGTLQFNNGTNQHMRPTGNILISNPITMTTGFAMDTVVGDTTSTLTFAGPITMTNNRTITNGFTAGQAGGTLIIGSAAAPNTLTMAATSSFSLTFAAVAGPIIVNDTLVNASGQTDSLIINPNGTNSNYVALNGPNTFTGGTTIGSTTNANAGGTVGIGISTVGSPGAPTSGPFGTGTLLMSQTAAAIIPPTLVAAGADRTVANPITMTGVFAVGNGTAAQDPTGNHSLALTGPITVGATGSTLTNNLAPGTTLTLGAVASPSMITLTSTLTFQSSAPAGGGVTTINDTLIGAGGLTVLGGTVNLAAANNPFNGGIVIQAGTVAAATDAALGGGAVTGTSPAATLSFTGTTATNRLLLMGGGTISVAGGQTVTLNGNSVGSAVLDGTGTFASNGAQIVNVQTTPSVTVTSTNAADQFRHFENSGAMTVAAGVNTAGTSTTVNFNGFTNEGLGSVTVGAQSRVNASNFQSYGTVTLSPGTGSNPTQLTNVGTVALGFNGGSRTFISQVGHGSLFDAGIDLNGNNAVVSAGLFVNNGYVVDSSSGGLGTATVVADFGSLVKGAGFFQNSVITQNGGKFQAGNSPGLASFGSFVLGKGGVSDYVFAIDDATGAAGPIPDSAGKVSGWGLVKAVSQGPNGANSGNFTWTATPADRLAVSIQTLVNPTTVGVDVPGPMADFDPTKSYSWPAIEWSGTYAGPSDAAVLAASTAFDTGEFRNPLAGVFGWSLDVGHGTLSLTYTPTAVPEPGSLILVAAAAGGLIGRRRRHIRTRVNAKGT
jgi:autotransporter-associated beta strand protein